MKSPVLKAVLLALFICQTAYIFLLHSQNNELRSRLSTNEVGNPIPPGTDESYSESSPGQNPSLQVTTTREDPESAREADTPVALLNNLANNVVDARELTEEERMGVQRELMIENMSDPRIRENAVRTSLEFQYGGFLDSLDLTSKEEEALETQLLDILAASHDLSIQRMRKEISVEEFRNYPLKENIREVFESFLGKDELAQLDEYESGKEERYRQRNLDVMKSQIAVMAPRLEESNRELMATVITDELASLQQAVTQSGDERTNLFRVAHLNSITKLAENEDMDPDQLELALEYLQRQLEQIPETLP